MRHHQAVSLLRLGVGTRLAVVAVVVGLLWLGVYWALY